MMTQTKYKIFNKKIKLLLLILIWTALMWHRCSAAREESKAEATAASKVEKALMLFNANAFDVVANVSDVVYKNDVAAVNADDRNNGIYKSNSSNSNSNEVHNGEKQAFKGQLSNDNEMADDDVYDAAAESNNSNASINDKSNEEQRTLKNAVELADITTVNDIAVEHQSAVGDIDNVAVVKNFNDIEDVHFSNETDSSNNNETDSKTKNVDANENEMESATTTTLLLQNLIYDFAIKYKQIPRVTFFTCSASSSNIKSQSNKSFYKINTIEILKRMYSSGSNIGITTAMEQVNKSSSNKQAYNDSNIPLQSTTYAWWQRQQQQQQQPKDILIKVVQIDQFINKRRNNNKNYNSYDYNNNKRRSSAASGYGYERRNVNVVAAPSRVGVAVPSGFGNSSPFVGSRRRGRFGSSGYTNANWLENALHSDRLRQIVVLDLSCGQASRKLIEMASNKGLFNSTYHWLLIEEDYAFNRQQQQIPSNNNNNNDEVKKQDIIAATNINSKTVANRFVAAKSMQQQQQPRKYVAGNNRQQRRYATSNEPSAAADTENDMEIIEKFLEKINININTELILAKYRRRRRRRCCPWRMADAFGSGGDGGNVAAADSFNKALQRQDYYMLYDVWSSGLQYGGKLNISEIGNFSLDDGLQIAPWYLRSTTITRRMDMKNARIRCLIVITNKNRTDTLEHYLTTHYDTHLDSMNRFNFALLSHVRDLYNFSFILSKTSSWGYLKNGKFDGMIGALVRKQTDVGGSPIFFRIERAKVIDYTSRTWVARPCFIFRHPRGTKKDRIVFLQPFSNDVWIFLAFCGSITIILLWTLGNIERKIGTKARNLEKKKSFRNAVVSTSSMSSMAPWQTNSFVLAETGKTIESTGAAAAALTMLESVAAKTTLQQQTNNVGARVAVAKQTAVVAAGHDTIKRRLLVRCGDIFCGQDGNDASRHRRLGLFLESVLFYIGSICQQGLAYSTSFFSGRCIVITSLFFSFAIYQFYSASIVGTLLMEKPKTIRTLRDLIHSSLEIGIEDIVYNRDYFLRTNDPDAIELYAKKVTSVPMSTEQGYLDVPIDSETHALATASSDVAAAQAKSYRDILHSHETGAHAKTNEASNWYDPEYGVQKIQKGRFAFHVDVATAYKIISDTFTEKEICDLTEIQLFPPQKMVSIVQKGSPLRKIFTYGLRRVTEVGLMDYQRKIWHSPKPLCVKQIHTDDLRVDMQTFTSALLVLIFGYAVSLLALGLEIMHHKLWQRRMAALE